jgi:hypothetical protein
VLNPPNRRIRTRTYGGVGGAEPRGSPLSRFAPASEPGFTFRGADVVEVGVDQGMEFVSRDSDLLAYQGGVTLDFWRW